MLAAAKELARESDVAELIQVQLGSRVGPVRDTGGPRRDAIDVVFAPEKHTTVGRVSMRDASLVQTSESAPISSRDDVLQPAHTKIRA